MPRFFAVFCCFLLLLIPTVNAESTFPEAGELYRDPEYQNNDCTLTFKLTLGEKAALIKLYDAETNRLISTAFTPDSGTLSLDLPAASYVVRIGMGTTWLGEEQSFGESGSYTRLTFEGGDILTLEPNRIYTLTLIVSGAPTNVAQETESPEAFNAK